MGEKSGVRKAARESGLGYGRSVSDVEESESPNCSIASVSHPG